MNLEQARRNRHQVAQTWRTIDEVQLVLAETRRAVAESQRLLDEARRSGAGVRAVALPAVTSPAPDALCACFDALMEAAQQAEYDADPELCRCIERALSRAGKRLEQRLATMRDDRTL